VQNYFGHITLVITRAYKTPNEEFHFQHPTNTAMNLKFEKMRPVS